MGRKRRIVAIALFLIGFLFLYSGITGAGQPIMTYICGASPSFPCQTSGGSSSSSATSSATTTATTITTSGYTISYTSATSTTTVISSSSNVISQNVLITVVNSGTPVSGATVTLTAVMMNANPVPPAYIGTPASLSPSSASGATNVQGQFTFAVTQDNQGILYGYYSSGGSEYCCGAIYFYNFYQITIVSNGITYGPYQYIDPSSSSNWQVNIGSLSQTCPASDYYTVNAQGLAVCVIARSGQTDFVIGNPNANPITQMSIFGRLSLLPGSVVGVSNNFLGAFAFFGSGVLLLVKRRK